MKPYFLYFIVFLSAWFPVSPQDIAPHQWEDRVLIVMTTDSASAEFERQVQELKSHQQGINERKLKVYLATSEANRLWNTPEISWKPGADLFETYYKRSTDPEVLLIGLDGQPKYHKFSFTPAKEIFKVIDGMPMRQSEMRIIKNQKKGK